MKHVCEWCNKQFVGHGRCRYCSNSCKQYAARSRRNERKKALNIAEVTVLADIYAHLAYDPAEVEIMLMSLVGCHARNQWYDKLEVIHRLVHNAGQTAYVEGVNHVK